MLMCSIDNLYVDNGNWQVESYNRGVKAGANQVVEKYEKQCLEETPDECNDLGEAAAQGKMMSFYTIFVLSRPCLSELILL